METYHSLDVQQTLQSVDSTPNGLTHIVAKERLAKNGKNVLDKGKKKSSFLKFLSQFKDVLIIVLLISSVVSIVMASIEKKYEEFIDAGIILFVVFFNAIFGFVQERKSEQAMEALKNITKPFCKVVRNGKTMKIKSEELVVGDIVVLEAGDIVPADLRLLETSSLKIEESALTGESVPVEKNAEVCLDSSAVLGDRVNMAYMGGIVAYGRGTGIVVACGMKTEMGKIATALNEIETPQTPLTKRIKTTSLIITGIVLAVCVVLFIVQISTGGSLFNSFSMAIAIAVCAIPEGLPACNTVIMSMGVKRMSDQRAIVKSLPAVETLGSTEVICSDKTGTLTLNKMTVQKIYFMGESCQKVDDIDVLKMERDAIQAGRSVQEVGVETLQNFKKDKNFIELLRCMLLCNDSKLKFEDGKIETVGDPTEIALVHYGYRLGISKDNLEGKFRRVNEIPFDSERKLMTTFNLVDDKNVVYTKGAVDNILARCNRILDNGKIRKLTETDKKQILEKNSLFASFALRNLAFAFKTVDKIGKPSSKNTEFDLCFLGLVGMIDPPRDEVKASIKTCKQAGITTIMITGDHKDTAFAIAKELGICNDASKAVTGAELDEIPDEEFVTLVNKFQVYARVSPQHKVKIVKALKQNNKIVAMTGDGVNDAPSIKAADIGVGMGITGTDVTKEAADIILTDDNFATIVGAVKEGRRVYSTILKVLMFLLGTSIAELVSMSFILIVFRNENFFSPILLLWINFVSDTFVALALGFEKAESDIMKRKPIKNSGNLFKGNVGANILASSLFVAVVMISLYVVCTYAFKLLPEQVTTVCFIYLAFVQLFHSYNLKNQNESLFKTNPFGNKVLNWAFLGSALLTVLIVILPIAPIQNAFGVCMINWWQWLLALGLAILIVPYFELVKLILNHKRKK